MFGVEGIDYTDWFSKLAVGLSGLTGMKAEAVLREVYEERFGIVPSHVLDDESRPFGALAYQQRDGITELWPKYNRVRQFWLYKVKDRCGCSLEEFLSYPRDLVEMILADLMQEFETKKSSAALSGNKDPISAAVQTAVEKEMGR